MFRLFGLLLVGLVVASSASASDGNLVPIGECGFFDRSRSNIKYNIDSQFGDRYFTFFKDDSTFYYKLSKNKHSEKSSWVSPRAQVDGQLTQSVIEAGATVPKGVELNQCVVWENVTVPKGKYRGCIFTGTHVIKADPSQQSE